MRIDDADGNIARVDEVYQEDFVWIDSAGVWFTPAQARRFAAAICKVADRVAAKKKKRTR